MDVQRGISLPPNLHAPGGAESDRPSCFSSAQSIREHIRTAAVSCCEIAYMMTGEFVIRVGVNL